MFNQTHIGNTPVHLGTAPMAKRRRQRKIPDLPQFYYHTHFCEMLNVIDRQYIDILNSEASNFLRQFGTLSFTAQCAYVRFAGRKGSIFDLSKFNYPEIQGLKQAIDELRFARFIIPVTEQLSRDFFTLLTKPDLLQLLKENSCPSTFKASWIKPRLIDTALSNIDLNAVHIPEHYVAQGQLEPLHYLLFLYFGRIETNLQPFTMRDLGLVKASDYQAEITARFDTVEEAESAYFYEKALYDVRNGSEDNTVALIDKVDSWPDPIGSRSQQKRDKLLHKLGGLSERLGDIDTALTLYKKSLSALCNEREIRILYKRNQHSDRERVKARLEAIIENPSSDTEHDFAQDFYARKYKKKRTSAVTDMLRAGQTLELDEAFKGSPERAAKRYYEQQNYHVFRSENAPWRVLFGLLFWDYLFGSNAKAIHSPFQRMPEDLKTGCFYVRKETVIESILLSLQNKNKTLLTILKTASQHYGTPNGVFRWKSRNMENVQTLIKYAPTEALTEMMRLMAQDYQAQKDGYPDLMRLKDGSLSFIEVKSEGDVIRRNQLTRMRQLKSVGFDVKIAKIDWVVDPQQIYVVIDLETTGGRAGNHRVTEIGAVKIQNGEIIDEWQTLLNPQRSIPAPITRLTGISEDMVAGAPLFAEVADAFSDFMGDAIFVAHNVNFDFGFLKMEYERLGRRFRFPKLCTCAGMRKHYPGHRSYSLKNLTNTFQIELKTHHRALCDAKAAAELLKLINVKRLDA